MAGGVTSSRPSGANARRQAGSGQYVIGKAFNTEDEDWDF